jgi:biotin carboxylase
MMARPTILYVNTRRPSLEVREAFFAARRLGFDVALIADRRIAHLEPFTVAVEVLDTYEVERIVDTARALAARFDVRGIVTWGDRDVEAVAAVAQALGLPGPSPAAARLARNKFEMKEAVRASASDVLPRFARIASRDDLATAVETVGLPGILKPVGASGSRGIHEVRSRDDADRAYDLLSEYTQPTVDAIFRQYGAELIYEELIVGDEVVVEGWIHEGVPTIAGITDTLTSDPWHLEVQHLLPSRLPPEAIAGITDATRRIIAAVGLDACAFHIDGKWSPDGFRFFEIAARIGGDYETSHLVPLATGIDFYAQLLRIVTGQAPVPDEPRDLGVAGVRFAFADRPGRLDGVDGIDEALRLPPVEHVSLETAPGTTLALPPAQFTEPRYAAVLARDPDYDVVADTLKRATELLRPRFDPTG